MEDVRDLINPAELFKRLNQGIKEIDRSIRELGEALEGKGASPELEGEIAQRLERARQEVEAAKLETMCDWCKKRLGQISDALARMAEMEKLSVEFLETKKAIEKLQEK